MNLNNYDVVPTKCIECVLMSQSTVLGFIMQNVFEKQSVFQAEKTYCSHWSFSLPIVFHVMPGQHQKDMDCGSGTVELFIKVTLTCYDFSVMLLKGSYSGVPRILINGHFNL